MPIYEYKCNVCGEVSEILHKVDAPLESGCSYCSSMDLERMISKTGFRLNGSGWYETDFKDGPKRNLKVNESENKKANTDKGEGVKSNKGKESSNVKPGSKDSTSGKTTTTSETKSKK